jgi:endo-1,4-beta-xylanase
MSLTSFLVRALAWGALAASLPASAAPSLADAYRPRLLIGAAIEPSQLDGPDGALLAAQFGSVVAENAMKPANIHPREDSYNFAPADAVVDFAQRRHLAVRGHTLLWHKRTPDWFWTAPDGQPASRALVLERLRRHIDTVVGRYKGKVYAWDVVNEVIDASQPNCLRDDRWMRVVGPEYVAAAFRYAHAADPGARLFINDYSTHEPAKRDCLVRVIKGLLADGVPVQGVGHQMHISIYWPSPASVDASLTAFARLGLENQITELDMSLYQHRDYRPMSPEERQRRLALQASRYGELMTLFLAHRELTAVTWWGVADDHTALNADAGAPGDDQPLLFDRLQQPKPAYREVVQRAPGR